jgi:5-methylcytosine-specific restriction enzyme A
MPSSAFRPCAQPGCITLVISGRCKSHSLDHALKRDSKVKRMYNSRQWQRIRKQQLALSVIPSLAGFPLCRECLKEGQITEATEVDHVHPHRGDEAKFFQGPFDTLCKRHHSSKTRKELGL